MAVNPQNIPVSKGYLGGLARRIVAEGLLSEEQARTAQQKAQRSGQSLVSYAVEQKWAPARGLAMAASREFGVPVADLSALEVDNSLASEVGEKVLRKHRALPLYRRGKRLFVAISDPSFNQALEEIKFATGQPTEGVLVEDDKLGKAMEAALSAVDAASLSGDESEFDDIDLEAGGREDQAVDATATQSDAEDAPVVRYVNKVLLDAIRRGASDIHFEPYEKYYRVRLRVDGELREFARPPVQIAARLAARVKVLSRLDLAERRVPQDGRIKLKLSAQRAIDFRVSTCPTLWGEKIVLRILDSSSAQLGIESLGYEPDQRALYENALSKPQGMILVTGPTGSGKTVSLYTGLNILNTEGLNISTAEDPAEINLPGINQVNVNPRVGLTFAAALKAFLRQDPDVIMVGEVRDLETAEIAIKAAQTGHLVLSTLHTNDAPQTLTRLLNMGVPAYNIASSVSLIIAQRLAKRLCTHCRKEADIPRVELLKEGFTEEQVDSEGFRIYEAQGCEECHSGYKGRTGIYQVMPVSETIGRMIMEGKNAIDVADQAEREGVLDLRQSALKKVRDGIIDLKEANRVTVE
ncbi:MAG: type IV-A pilus assembly ATPase PilB [Algiphilus sp.]